MYHLTFYLVMLLAVLPAQRRIGNNVIFMNDTERKIDAKR